MANKKNPGNKKKNVSGSSSTKKNTSAKSTKKPKTAKKTPAVKTEYERAVPPTALTACISLALFVLFLVIGIKPEGTLLQAIQQLLYGMVGQAGFYLFIPALLYIFIINTFGRKDQVVMRTGCMTGFVLCCGSIYHLVVQTQGIAGGFAVITDLYMGGISGLTGGVLCGGLAVMLRWGCGNIISFILLGIAAVLTLLGSMQITIPSILRAIANRPREELEEEDEQEEVYIEPAALVVNHIANKQIEHKRQKRQRQIEEFEQMQIPEPVPTPAPRVRKQPITPAPVEPVITRTPTPASVPVPQKQIPVSNTPANAARMMNTIALDTSAPIAGGSRNHIAYTDEPIIPITPMTPIQKAAPVVVEPEEEHEEIAPTRMPELDLETQFSSHAKAPAKIEKTEKPAPRPAKSSPVESKPGKVSAKDAEESAQEVAQEIAQGQAEKKAEYCFPPIDLLKRPINGAADGTDEMRENSRRLNETLASFRIDAHITNVTRGPSVTRYEVELDKGVRLNKLTGCADDIALSLGASGVRIAAVPGKISIVGIEVPNRSVTTVSLREVIDSNEFSKSKSKSSFAVGKDIGGSCIIGNISKMPHMLIAGTTGSGKSVCMNSIIISLLYKSGPEDVKLIMVDPKMVELGIYNGIPHLLIPVVTDPKKAAGSLQWAVTEMLRRYKMMSDVGVRDLEAYNSIVTKEEGGQKLPQVVIIIDELADLMLVAAKEVEDSICRVAQMGRAAGMHLIIATQRPSADVITGLMKANIPSRIAFSVASSMESRIILDTQGAEKLVGKGDMLYAPIGIGKPLRVQGCFVTDLEVEAVAGYVKDNYDPNYDQQIVEEIEKKALQQPAKGKAPDPEPTAEEMDGDEMLPAAVEVILETKQASVSMLQRRLKLGYARAARIVDEMEEKGIVGPFQGSKPRAILVTKEQWDAMKGSSDQMSFDSTEEYPISDEID